MKKHLIHCTECERPVSGAVAAAEGWTYWSDGRDLNPYCPECANREFAPDAPPASPVSPLRLNSSLDA
jgi:hypothetical protein